MFAFICFAFIIAFFFAWFYTQKSKEDERRLLIEKGFNPSELPDRRTFNFRFPWLKIGCVITGAAIGAITGFIFGTYLDRIGAAPHPGPVFLTFIFLFGGIGMIIAHYIDKPNDKS